MIKYRYSINGQVVKENSLSYNGLILGDNNIDRSIEILARSASALSDLRNSLSTSNFNLNPLGRLKSILGLI